MRKGPKHYTGPPIGHPLHPAVRGEDVRVRRRRGPARSQARLGRGSFRGAVYEVAAAAQEPVAASDHEARNKSTLDRSTVCTDGSSLYVFADFCTYFHPIYSLVSNLSNKHGSDQVCAQFLLCTDSNLSLQFGPWLLLVRHLA